MLALLGIGVNLYEDAGGVPGPLIGDDSVSVGDTFFAEITVEDLRSEPQGVNGLSLDLAWDADGLEVINDPFNPADFTSPLVTSAFTGFRGGTLDESRPAAMIDDLRGLGPSQSGIGDAGPERYSLIHFRADAVSAEPLRIAIGDIGAGLVNYLRNLLPADIQIEQPTIRVVEGQVDDPPPPQVSIGDASINEGDAGITEVALSVQLSAPADQPVTVLVNTRDDQALASDGDYQAVVGQTLTFSPGITQLDVVVQVQGDERVEGHERFFVELSEPVGATLGDAVGRIVILNDDVAQPVPEVAYSLELFAADGSPLPVNADGRYVLDAGASVTARVHVTDPRSDATAGVFAAFADLVSNSPHFLWQAESLMIAPEFVNARSGQVSGDPRVVDEAGGAAGTDPTGGGQRQLLFEVQGRLASTAPQNTVFTVSLNAADAAEHETFVFGLGDPARATYQSAQVLVATGPTDDDPSPRGWQNSDDPLDVNADGLRSPQDVLLIINELIARGPHLLDGEGPAAGEWQLDVNGDGGVSRLDALLIFNYLTFGTPPENLAAEGEAAGFAADAPRVPRDETPFLPRLSRDLTGLSTAVAFPGDAGLDWADAVETADSFDQTCLPLPASPRKLPAPELVDRLMRQF